LIELPPGSPTLGWAVTYKGKVVEYEMGFGKLRGEPTAIVFASILSPDGVSEVEEPVIFIPKTVMDDAAITGWSHLDE